MAADAGGFDSFIREAEARAGNVKVFHPRIIIMGTAGAGKSTMVNSTFRQNIARTNPANRQTEGVVTYPPTDACPMWLYDTQGLVEDEGENRQLRQRLTDLLQERRAAARDHAEGSGEQQAELIHAVWWVDHGRLNPNIVAEVRLAMGDDVPFFLVLNKCDQPKRRVRRRIRAARRLNPQNGVWPVMACGEFPYMRVCEACGSDRIMTGGGKYTCKNGGPAEDIEEGTASESDRDRGSGSDAEGGSEHSGDEGPPTACPRYNRLVRFNKVYGINELVIATLDALPELVRAALVSSLRDSAVAARHFASGLIRAHSTLAGGIVLFNAAVSHVAFLDYPGLLMNQVAMGSHMATAYRITITRTVIGKVVLTTVFGGAGLGKCLASCLRSVVGTVLGPVLAATDMAVATAVTFAVGHVLLELMERAHKAKVTEVQFTDVDRLFPLAARMAEFAATLSRPAEDPTA